MPTRQNKPKLNEKKAREVILYLLNRCGTMTQEKLCCLLYFLEFDYYEKYEEHICGWTFIKK